MKSLHWYPVLHLCLSITGLARPVCTCLFFTHRNISNTSTILCKLGKIFKFFSLFQHMQQSLVILLVMFYLQHITTLGLVP
mmetsp:Transcript_32601/g.5903  ORF Transcript_32601/g.5903 Transcript_32601/m.5903 type:complete len:81 (-) Transcript_32601:493-735(-)